MTRRARPDWDITTPEMRAAWERRQRECFFPSGRSLREVFAEG
jgi:hypothetical protein